MVGKNKVDIESTLEKGIPELYLDHLIQVEQKYEKCFIQHDCNAIPVCFQLQIWMHFFVLGIMFDIILCRHSIVGREDFFQRQFQSITKAKKSQRDYLVIRVRVQKKRPHTIIASHIAQLLA